MVFELVAVVYFKKHCRITYYLFNLLIASAVVNKSPHRVNLWSNTRTRTFSFKGYGVTGKYPNKGIFSADLGRDAEHLVNRLYATVCATAKLVEYNLDAA